MESKALIPINEVKEMALQACKSGMFSMPNESATFTLMMLCQAEGLHPIQALKRYHIIKGRPAMRADAMLAEFQRADGYVKWLERSDKKVSATFSHEQGGEITVTWTIEMAKQAGLIGNPTWQKFPRQMLTARVISEGVRTIYPAVITGLYTPEEISDFDAKPVEVKPETTEKPKKTTKKAPKKAEKPQEIIEDAQVVDEKPQTLAEKTGFKPEPAKETTSAGQVAKEIKQIRKMAQDYGCKNIADFEDLMQTIIGKKVSNTNSLSNNERAAVMGFLSEALKEAA